MMPLNSKPKRMKLSDESLNADIISNLPDSIVSHILCFLPTTREVVGTSILSKRWRYVWTCVEKLIIISSNGRDVKQRRNFAQFVYRVLKCHQGNIKDFEMYCFDRGCKEFDFTSWVNIALARGVERLDVTSAFNWPLSIFTCKTLVDLKINSRHCDCRGMNIPSAPIFPCLKKLHLNLVYFDAGILKRIVSQCPALEYLIVDSELSSETSLGIVSSSIKRLQIQSSLPTCSEKKILLGAPNLEYLQIYCTLPFQFIVEDQLSSLIEADIYFPEHSCSGEIDIKLIRDSFGRIIQHLSNVKVLRMDCYFQRRQESMGSKRFCLYGVQASKSLLIKLTHAASSHKLSSFSTLLGMSEFLNLTKLEIASAFFEWRLLLSLMENSINLEAITLKKTSTFKKHKLVWKEPKKVPTCVSSSLRKISIDGYSEDELPMVKYVLGTAQILERMDIRFANYYTNQWKNHLFQNIQKLHRACRRCEISLAEKTVACSVIAKLESSTVYHHH